MTVTVSLTIFGVTIFTWARRTEAPPPTLDKEALYKEFCARLQASIDNVRGV